MFYALLAVLLVASVTGFLATDAYRQGLRLVNLAVIAIAYVVAAVWCFDIVRGMPRGRLERIGWIFGGMASASVLLVAVILLGRRPPSATAVAFDQLTAWISVASYSLFLLHLLTLAATFEPRRWSRFFAEAIIASLTVGILLFSLVVAPLRTANPEAVTRLGVMVVTPIMDVLAIYIGYRVQKAVGVTNVSPALRWLLISGFLRVPVNTLGLLTWGLEMPLAPAVSFSGAATALTFACAAWHRRHALRAAPVLPPAPETPTGSLTLRDTIWPYVCVFLVLILVRFLSSGFVMYDRRLVEYVSIVLVFAVFWRQAQVIAENRALSQLVENTNRTLEEKVVARGSQIQALHQFGKAVHASLNEIEILDRAHRNARAVFGAEECEIIVQATGGDGGRTVPYRHGSLSRDSDGDHEMMQTLQASSEFSGSIRLRRRLGAFDAHEAKMLDLVAIELTSALENARLYGQALSASYLDHLTGLLNHRGISSSLGRALSQQEPFSILCVDIDNFRNLNEALGHVSCDEILRRVGQGIKRILRPQDAIGRNGSDEFLVILPGVAKADAGGLAERIREFMRAQEGWSVGGHHDLPIQVSVGIASYPQDGTTRMELLNAVEAMVLDAKGSRRGISALEEEESHEKLWMASTHVFRAMVDAIDAKDSYTRKHSEEVTDYALMIGERLGLSEATLRSLRLAGLIHDLGKIAVADAVLRKVGPLTDSEREDMNRHPVVGASIAESIGLPPEIVEAVRGHHERFDGQGYPDRIAGEAISLLARVLAVADAFSAMTTDRPYRRALSRQDALKELERGTGRQFDPVCVRAFVEADLPPAYGVAAIPNEDPQVTEVGTSGENPS